MPELGVIVAVTRGNAVLLTRREDFDVWCLPGGAVEPHETADQAALREVREETGIEVALTRLVGVCAKPFWGAGGTHHLLFAAAPLGEVLQPALAEVTEAGYFDRDRLPEPLLWDHHFYVRAAFAGCSGLCWHNPERMPPEFADRAALYRWRDSLGVARREAYWQLVARMGPPVMQLVLGEPSGGAALESAPAEPSAGDPPAAAIRKLQ